MSVIYRPDTSWTDVIFTARGFQQVAAGAGFVDVGWLGEWTRRDVAGVDVLRYIDAASDPEGHVACIGVGGNDYAYLVTASGVSTARKSAVTVVSLGPVYVPPPIPGSRQQAFAQNSVGLFWRDGWVAVVQRTATTYTVGPETRTFPYAEGTSQGFRDVQPNGAIIFGDDAHLVTIAGVTLHKPMTRGGLTVGQINGPDRIDGVYGFGKHFSAIPGQAFEPKVAWDLADSWAIVARTGLGAASTVVPPYGAVPVEPPPIVIPPVVVPPLHPPIDPPEVPPVANPTVPNYVAHVQTRAAEFPDFTKDELTDEQRIDAAAKLTAICAYDLHFGVAGAPRDPRVGLFRKGNKYGFDENRLFFRFAAEDVCCFAKIVIQTGASHASIGWNETETFFPHGGPEFMVPSPVPGVHDGTAPPVEPPPVVTPPVTPPDATIPGRVAQLEREAILDRRQQDGTQEQANQADEAAEKLDTRVRDLKTTVDALQQQPPGAPAPLPADVVRESTHEGRIFGQPVKLGKKPPKREGKP